MVEFDTTDEENEARIVENSMQAAVEQRRRLTTACVVVFITFPARAVFDLHNACSAFNASKLGFPPPAQCATDVNRIRVSFEHVSTSRPSFRRLCFTEHSPAADDNALADNQGLCAEWADRYGCTAVHRKC